MARLARIGSGIQNEAQPLPGSLSGPPGRLCKLLGRGLNPVPASAFSLCPGDRAGRGPASMRLPAPAREAGMENRYGQGRLGGQGRGRPGHTRRFANQISTRIDFCGLVGLSGQCDTLNRGSRGGNAPDFPPRLPQGPPGKVHNNSSQGVLRRMYGMGSPGSSELHQSAMPALSLPAFYVKD